MAIDRYAAENLDFQESIKKSAKETAKHFADISDSTEETKSNLEETTESGDTLSKITEKTAQHQQTFNKYSIMALGIVAALVGEYNAVSKSVSETAASVGIVDKRLIGWYDVSRKISTEFALHGVEVEDVMGLIQNITQATGGILLSAESMRSQLTSLTALQAHWNIDTEILGDIWQALIIRGGNFEELMTDVHQIAKDTGVAIGFIVEQIKEAGDKAKALMITMGPRGLMRMTGEIIESGGRLSEILAYSGELFSDIAGTVQNAAQFSALFSGSIDLMSRRTAALSNNYEMIAKSNRQLVEQNISILTRQGEVGFMAQQKFAETTGMSIESLHKIITGIRIETGSVVEKLDAWRQVLRTGEFVTFADMMNQIKKSLSVVATPMVKTLMPAISKLAEIINTIVTHTMVWMEQHPILSKALLWTGTILIFVAGGALKLLTMLGPISEVFQGMLKLLPLLNIHLSTLNISLKAFTISMMHFMAVSGVLLAVGFAIYMIWKKWGKTMPWLATLLTGLSVGVGVLTIGIITMGTAFNVAFAGIPLLIAGIVTGVMLLIRNWDKVIGWVKGNWPLLIGIIFGPFGIMITLIIKFRKQIVETLKNVFDFVKTWALKIAGFLLKPYVMFFQLINKLPFINIPIPKWALSMTGLGVEEGTKAAINANRAVTEVGRAKGELEAKRVEKTTLETQVTLKETIRDINVVSTTPNVYLEGVMVSKALTKAAVEG